jgi:cation diffusion facilitator CzcD-associated flavoprotein CzcO
VPIHLYSLSSDLKPDWRNSHGTQPEILEYMQGVAKKRDLRKHCRFHTSVDKAEWDATANVWRIEIRDVRTGEKQVIRATALVSAIGVLVVPSFPKLQGIESFKGEVFHSARWNHDVDLHGKRVGVVGNGGSAYVDLFIYLSGVLHVALIVKYFASGHNSSQRYPQTQPSAS